MSIQDEKSQLKNKDKAFRVLRSRLYQLERDRIHDERAEARKELVGSGDRSAKIRTYNFPQGRVTDHRLDGDDKNHALEGVLAGDLAAIVRALQLADRAARMEEGASESGPSGLKRGHEPSGSASATDASTLAVALAAFTFRAHDPLPHPPRRDGRERRRASCRGAGWTRTSTPSAARRPRRSPGASPTSRSTPS